MGSLSVVIITLNEEVNLRRCIASLPTNCEIIVVDSHSTDNTLKIALELGARTETRAFTNYAEQKNHACSLATGDWILSLDADEVLDKSLCNSLTQFTQNPHPHIDGYKLKRKLVFQGHTLTYGKSSDAPIRLFKRDSAKFVGKIHEKLEFTGGRIGHYSTGYLSHYSYQDLSDYFSRFNKYTSLIAETQGKKFDTMRFHVNLYLRFWFEFMNRYIVRLGFLDGYPGYCYALISSLYTFVKYAKIREFHENNF